MGHNVTSKTFDQAKDVRRDRLDRDPGSRQVIGWAWGDWMFPLVAHPNRILRQFRLSNRRRAA
jgi:hypothetical protein